MLLILLTCLTVWVAYSKIATDFLGVFGEVLSVTVVHSVLYLSPVYAGKRD